MGTSNLIGANSQGIVYYDGAGSFSGVDGSDAGKVLTSNGTGVAPSFQNVGGGSGGWVLLDTQDFTGKTNVDFTTGMTSTYTQYAMVGGPIRVRSTTASSPTYVQMAMYFSNNGGSSFSTSNYQFYGYSFGGGVSPSSTISILLTKTLVNVGDFISFYLFFHGLGNSTVTTLEGSSTYIAHLSISSSGGYDFRGYNSMTDVNALRIGVFSSNGNSAVWDYGTASLYGIPS